jgi:hypothetical protein
MNYLKIDASNDRPVLRDLVQAIQQAAEDNVAVAFAARMHNLFFRQNSRQANRNGIAGVDIADWLPKLPTDK